jgi:hypothetical protein
MRGIAFTKAAREGPIALMADTTDFRSIKVDRHFVDDQTDHGDPGFWRNLAENL